MKNIKKLLTISAVCGILCVFLTSCYSVPSEVPEELTPDQIINDAIAFGDNNNPAAAKFYYEALLERYGTDNNYRVVGEYEIGHLLVKQGKYSEALPYLYDVIATIENDYYGSIPAKYYVLAQNDIDRALNKGATVTEESEEDEEDY
ncbi:MAG: hypothetical protein MJ196_05945 [Treponemataceae bacterium]|nr:hypothetical protein [Treponemataceae bacterium]